MSCTRPQLLRVSLAVGIGVVGAAAALIAVSPAHAQAEIRSRDVLTSDWSSPLPAATTSTLPGLGSPSWNQPPASWRLGVAIENMETGVLLTDVERGLPADNAGLERGDVIIAVGGYQVGYVNGALFDLGDELRRRTEPTGKVTFLVFDGRNRQLRSMPVTLVQQSQGKVRGQVACRERISLSSQAVLTVRLRDVTFPTWQNVQVGQHVTPNPPHPPISYTIDFDPSTIYPDHKYAIDAWLLDRGQVVVQTATATPVNPLNATSPIQLTLVKPGGASSPGTSPGNVYASGQIDQINQWYRQYLLRDATTQELAAWQAHLQAGRTPQDVQAYILSSSEYYDRLGNQSSRYLTELYRNLFGRQPTAADLAAFQSQYQQYGGARSLFVQQVMQQPGR
jgi:uncharacterized lipoprotein YbaY